MFTDRLKVNDFNLEATLNSGQVFGFTETGGFFRGPIAGRAVELKQAGNDLWTRSSSKKNLVRDIRQYFDLDRDLTPIYEILEQEEPIRKTLDVFKGLRLIRQDSWEALACFIISSNNNVKRIQGIWRNLSSRISEDSCSFPKPREIAASHEKILRELGLGYRAPYLLRSAQFVAANPDSLKYIRGAEYEEAKERLLQFPGIGEKVADCVLLYGFQKFEAFPVDTWILRAMRKIYFKNQSVSKNKILRFAQNRWGKHAGYVQQYLFHSARMGVI